MKYAVIGASSFSGAAFCRYLESSAVPFIGLSRPLYDLNNASALYAMLDAQRPTHVVNFAALNMVGESWKFFADYYQTNVIGVASLAQWLSQRDYLERFVQVSTPEVYGSTEKSVEEWAGFKPSTPYAVSRAAADQHLMAMHHATGFPVTITRTVNVYGPGQQAYRIIPKTVLKVLRGEKLKLHGGGVSRRSFIHIDDVARAIWTVAGSHRAEGETYHISTDEQTRIRDLVLMVCNQLGVRFEDAVEMDADRTGKDMAYLLNDQKIRGEDFGWEPRIQLDEGLAETVDWFKEHAVEYVKHSLEYEHRP